MKDSVLGRTVKDLYDQDFYEWTARNAELLRTGRFAEADLEHVAEEIEDMGKSERRELVSRLSVLLSHLLKWRCQPNRRGRSWQATIRVQRTELMRLVADMPSPQLYLREQLPRPRPDRYFGYPELSPKRLLDLHGNKERMIPANCHQTGSDPIVGHSN